MKNEERISQVALGMLPGIGPVTSKKLVAYFGSAGEVFRQKKKALLQIPGIGPGIASALKNDAVLERAEKEVAFAKKNDIGIFCFTEANYPNRLKQCYDSPVVLFFKGNADLSHHRIIGIVGTRTPTAYGEMLTEKFVHEIAAENVMIISGLAYGIDIIAHKAALEAKIPTIGVLAHGLDRIYPQAHRSTAKKMMDNGGLLTDFPSGTKPDRENFPMRNRIVAGLCDAIVVIESGASGGSMITAEFANNYNRDVFAFPGKVGEKFSAGCHKLIKTHKAALIESADDVLNFMGWKSDDKKKKVTAKQTELLIPLSADEEKVVNAMRDRGNVFIDDISAASGLAMGKVSALLLQLEFSGVVKSLPGKMYRLN